MLAADFTSRLKSSDKKLNQHPEILAKLITDYDKFAKNVGVIVPSDQAEAF